IVRNSAVRAHCPTWPGGGSVAYVSPWAHDYLGSVIEREEAGTPNILGDIRAALAFLVKEAIGQEWITRRERELVVRAQEVWGKNPAIRLFGRNVSRLPIFSFAVRDGKGGYIHHQLFTRMLSDLTGIQARGGCVCAGPYGHRLLDVTRQQSEAIRDAIRHGHEIEKPGWVRLNLGYLMDDATVSTIIEKVNWLATNASEYAGLYRGHDNDASFTFRGKTAPVQQLCGG
ncbi:MAG TPA: aminotransferase class V-fold PLP-dependent enzyme, partial [Devosia sp.]|nr:aminotransferase class V-fold PLP-dependent enzyme [Devosia sp.]